jgi:hypothetical protein
VDLIDSISIYAGKTLIAGKSAQKKDPAQRRVSLHIHSKLAMSMMAVMTTMVTAICVRRNHRTSENDDCNGSKK